MPIGSGTGIHQDRGRFARAVHNVSVERLRTRVKLLVVSPVDADARFSLHGGGSVGSQTSFKETRGARLNLSSAYYMPVPSPCTLAGARRSAARVPLWIALTFFLRGCPLAVPFLFSSASRLSNDRFDGPFCALLSPAGETPFKLLVLIQDQAYGFILPSVIPRRSRP